MKELQKLYDERVSKVHCQNVTLDDLTQQKKELEKAVEAHKGNSDVLISMLNTNRVNYESHNGKLMKENKISLRNLKKKMAPLTDF